MKTLSHTKFNLASLLALLLILCSIATTAQYTQVPDPNFEQALIDLGYDDVIDGQFLTENASGVLEIFLDHKNINDLTGIEAFVDLHALHANSNNLTNVNLSLLPPTLHSLFLGTNNLTLIDLSPIPNIVNLSLIHNNFTQIDASNLTHMFALYLGGNTNLSNVFVSNCSNLQNIGLQNTSVNSIDLSECPSLRNFSSEDSQMSTLDFTNNQNLEKVRTQNTPLTSINLPNNPDLFYLAVSNTLLTELDVTHCPALIDLYCTNVGLTSIDVTQNPNLEWLIIEDNQITELNIKQNPNLTKVVCDYNNIQTVDFINSISLIRFICNNNPIEEFINLQGAQDLEELVAYETNLTEVDLSQNPNLIVVDFWISPNLEFVNLQNSNNENLALFVGTQCPELSCVVVDDPLANNDNFAIDEEVTTLVGSIEECESINTDESILQNAITIFPNPVQDVLYLTNSSNIKLEQITVYDILGKIVFITNDNFEKMNLSSLKNGVILVKIEKESGTITKKIIKKQK